MPVFNLLNASNHIIIKEISYNYLYNILPLFQYNKNDF